jgi:peptidyl-prolyl cis-trans isomerase B (cyclophilin B)
VGSLKPALAVLCAALALAACGGSSSDQPTDIATTAAADTGAAAAGTTTATATATGATGGDATCQSGQPPTASPKTYSSPPPAPKGGTLTMETSCGTMVFTLDPALGGPVTDAVAGLAAAGFYDGLTFHRVVPDFVLQGGDPDGTGAGGPGFSTVKAPPSDYAYKLGDVAMAKTQDEAPGTAGSQFFIISGASGEQLPPDYAVVAHTSDPASLATIARIGALAVTDGPPSQPVWIVKATVA